MTDTRKDRDDMTHAIGATMGFYGKQLDQMQLRFWLKALAEYGATEIREALDAHVASSKFAPKPVDIIDLVREYRRQRSQKAANPQASPKPADPKIAAAWLWFLKTVHGWTYPGRDAPKATPEQEERYLHIVNHEAKKHNQPDAIPDEFKLREVWGDAHGGTW